MHELPLLVVRGAIIAKLLVLAVAASAFGVVRMVRRVRDRRRVRREIRVRIATVSRLAEGSVALYGVWRDDGQRCWLDCDGERVDLEGEVRVLRGTRARWTWRAPHAVHRVRSGDEVIARGRLTRRGGGTEASYRQPDGRWILGPDRVPAHVEIFARFPAACPPPLRMRGVPVFAVFTAIAYGSLHAVGTATLEHDWTYHHDWYYHHQRELSALDAWQPAVIAAALPGTRDDALEVLAHQLDRAIVHTPASMEQSIALARLRGRDIEASVLITEGRFDDAARTADRGAPSQQTQALVLAGRFAEAAAVGDRGPEWSHAAGAASIGAGRWVEAAAILDQAIAAIPPALGNLAGLRHLTCLAELFRVHGGDRDAAERLRTRARQPAFPVCKIAEALLLPIDQQAAALAAARDRLDSLLGSSHDPSFEPGARLRHAVDLLLWTLRGEPVPARFASSLLYRPFVEYHAPPNDAREAWFAPLAVTGSPRADAWLAVHHALVGDWPAAHATARQLHDELAGDDWRWFDAQELDLEIQLREGVSPLELDPFGEHAGFRRTTASDHALLRWAVVSSDLVYDFLPYANTALDDTQRAVAAAADGDGGPLADIVERSNGAWSTAPGVLLALVPGVTRDRERLRSALSMLDGPSTSSVFEFLWSLAMRRDLARVAGDSAAAARYQAIVDRYREMLADRDKLLAFLLVDVFGPEYGLDLSGWFP